MSSNIPLSGAPDSRAGIATRRLLNSFTAHVAVPVAPARIPLPVGSEASGMERTRRAAASFLARAHRLQVQILSSANPQDPNWEIVRGIVPVYDANSNHRCWRDQQPLEAAVGLQLVQSYALGFQRLCRMTRRAPFDLDYLMRQAAPPKLLDLPFALIPVGGLPEAGGGISPSNGVLTVVTSEPFIDYLLPESWKVAIAEFYQLKRLAFMYSPVASLRHWLEAYAEDDLLEYTPVVMPDVPILEDRADIPLPPSEHEKVAPYVDVKSCQPRDQALEMFPAQTQTLRKMLPVYADRASGMVTLVAANIPTVQYRSELEKVIGGTPGARLQLFFVLGSAEAISSVVARGESSQVDMGYLVNRFSEQLDERGHGEGGGNITLIDANHLIALSRGELTAELSAAYIMQGIIAEGVDLGASDIHISNHETPAYRPGDVPKPYTRVRYTVDGETRAHSNHFPSGLASLLINTIKVEAKINPGHLLGAADGAFSVKYSGVQWDIRVNVQNTIHGEYTVMRLQNASTPIRSFSELGMREREINILQRLANRSTGMLAICGATGAGKSNTLWGLAQIIDRDSKNVVSLESPVERKLDKVEQVPIGNAPGNTFANGLRAALREAPHIIIVGETRDLETMEECMKASETGHVVCTTLHANTAAAAPQRLVNMGAREDADARAYSLSSNIYAIMAQRLVRLLCKCAVRRPAPTREELVLGGVHPEDMELFADIGEIMQPRPGGCPVCSGAGEKGRTGIYECIEMNTEFREAIRTQAPISRMRELQKAQGATSIFEQSVGLLRNGRISLKRCLSLIPD